MTTASRLANKSASRRIWLGAEARTAYLAILPALLVLGLFTVYPIIYSGYLSLNDWNGFSPDVTPVGFQNYLDWFQSPTFWHSLSVTLAYVAGLTIFSLVG